ncbi:family 43 glycosylhydrolase [Fructilactobacillus myrtifloralis]|uniref:Family 43 glycosylhydrolase n=1 Tax=Fructilactobacillus myrtifloralis TaxID=2940301 RepID=A0ABY5BPW5_9LACO|nr:family 43 glycosylhydrolase [Fructilactobacillus myrtifloralis]USS85087.1 family 43 glycosylhydrolase [Fructilactobacillus myrtifloralis]
MDIAKKIDNSTYTFIGFEPAWGKGSWGATSIICISDDGLNWRTVAKLPQLGGLRDHSVTRYKDSFYIVGTLAIYRTKDFSHFEQLAAPFYNNNLDSKWAPDLFQDKFGGYHVVLTATRKHADMGEGHRMVFIFDLDLDKGVFTNQWQRVAIDCGNDIDASIQYFQGKYYCFMSHGHVYVSDHYWGPYTHCNTNLPETFNGKIGYEEGPQVLMTNDRPLLFTDKLHTDPSKGWNQSYVVRRSVDGLTKWSDEQELICDAGQTQMRHGSFLYRGQPPVLQDYFPDVVSNSSLGTKVS